MTLESKILIISDIHGNLKDLSVALDKAHHNNVKEIVQLGDFGYGFSFDEDKCVFLTATQRLLEKYDINLTFISGNHDNCPHLWKRAGIDWENYTTTVKRTQLTENIAYQPFGSFNDGILWLGGGYSVDQDARIEGVDYWKEEEITDQQVGVAIVRAAVNNVRVVLTHEMPSSSPIFGAPSTWITQTHLEGSWVNQRKITEILHVARPELVVHGHMHTYYDVGVVNQHYNKTYRHRMVGLDHCGREASMMILNLETLETELVN